MIPEEISNTWSPRFYSLLRLTNFDVFVPKWPYEGTAKNNNDAESFATLVLYALWAVLYLCYKKLLDSMLRRMRIPCIKRNRIVDGLWYCGFSTCSIIFLTYFVPDSADPSCPWRRKSDFQLGFLIHKSFYLHQATAEIFVHRRWPKGWTIQLFASDIFAPLQQRWPAALSALLFYVASDACLLHSCKTLLTLSRNKIVKRIAKLLFGLHFLNWIYIYLLLVPGSLVLLYVDSNRNWKYQAFLWMWLICELFDSEFDCIYTKRCLEMSLFPLESKEALEFMIILIKHRRSVSNNKDAGEANAQKKKAELWQTLICAMTIKKKLKKRSKAKRMTEQQYCTECSQAGNGIEQALL